MATLAELLEHNQSFLVEKTSRCAKVRRGAARPFPSEGARAASIAELSDAMILTVLEHQAIPGIDGEDGPEHQEASAFGMREAKRHHGRGITLDTALSILKCYRRAYLDLVAGTTADLQQRELYLLWINHFFDHTELGFCKEWDVQSRTAGTRLQIGDCVPADFKYLTVFESIPNPVIVSDEDNRLVNLNESARHLFRHILQDPNRTPADGQSPRMLGDVLPWMAEEFEDFIRRGAMEARVEKDYVSPGEDMKNLVIQFRRILDADGTYTGNVIMLLDLSEQKRMEQQLRYMSFHDPMTSLYNRTYFEQEVLRATSGRFNPVGVISCDIDGLKLVNDSLGHYAGDALIMSVGRILRSCFRKSDMVARTGGDEFMALMMFSDLEAVRNVCQRVRACVEKHNLEHPNMPVGLSIGCSGGSVFEDAEIHQLLKDADSQMYAEKRENRSRYADLFAQRLRTFGRDLFRKMPAFEQENGE